MISNSINTISVTVMDWVNIMQSVKYKIKILQSLWILCICCCLDLYPKTKRSYYTFSYRSS